MFKIIYYNKSKCIAQSCPAVVHHSHLATARELKIFQIHLKIYVKIAAKTSRQNLGNNFMLTTQQTAGVPRETITQGCLLRARWEMTSAGIVNWEKKGWDAWASLLLTKALHTQHQRHLGMLIVGTLKTYASENTWTPECRHMGKAAFMASDISVLSQTFTTSFLLRR